MDSLDNQRGDKGNCMYDNGRSTRNINSRDSTTLKMEDISKIIVTHTIPWRSTNPDYGRFLFLFS